LAVLRPLEGVCGGANFFGSALYNQRAVFVSPLSTFSFNGMLNVHKYDDDDAKHYVHCKMGDLCIYAYKDDNGLTFVMAQKVTVIVIILLSFLNITFLHIKSICR